MRRSTITINGTTITTDGGNISISNGRITVGGKDVTPDAKTITITVQGDVDRIEADACDRISVSGGVNSVETESGNVECGNVAGSVKTMSGDVRCGDIGGPVQTMSGDVTCTRAPSANTMSGHVRGI